MEYQKAQFVQALGIYIYLNSFEKKSQNFPLINSNLSIIPSSIAAC